MNFSRTKFYKPMLIALACAFFFGVFHVQRAMNRDREVLGLTRMPPLENAPPVLAFTTVALGGFRGLLANALWIRANDLQENDKFFEMVQLSDWITKLEPHFVQVWLFQGWNMSYNISVKFSDPADRWRWVQRAIALYRDEALRYNPDEPLLYRELSWVYQHKMGNNLDDAQNFYKKEWADEMQKLFGGKPNFAELISPQTPEQKTRAKTLVEKYKMDPGLLKEVDELYGPLEWRLPEAHAIYWAELGRRKSKKEDEQTLRRSIYQSLQMAFVRGGFTENKIDKTFTLGPNLDLLPRVNGAYERLMDEDPTQKENMKTGHRNFLFNAVYFLYTANRQKEARYWFDYLGQKYPQSVLDKNHKKLSLEEFAIEQAMGDVGETDRNKTTQLILGALNHSYDALAQDEDDLAANYAAMAQKIWNRYQSEVKGSEIRTGLDSMEKLKTVVRDQVFDSERGFSQEMQARLRTKLGISAPTNAPADAIKK
ncbi:MAG: hypothetical protein ABI042_15765 [Verrucomicrobiota bacterium]